MKLFRKLGFQLILFFMVAILVSIALLSSSSINTTKKSMKDNMAVTSKQTLDEAQREFTTYLKTLAQPVDLLSRNNSVKHLEDQGDFDSNVKLVKDVLVASYKVTNGAERAFFTTNTKNYISGWAQLNPETGKTTNMGGLETGVDNTGKEWYNNCKGLKARNTIYSYFSDPYYDKELDKTIITVAQEIKYSNGDNYGAVGLHINFDEIVNYVQGIGMMNTGFVILVNKDGDILVNSDKNNLVKDNVSGLGFWNDMNNLDAEQLDTTFAFDEVIGGDDIHIVASKDAVTGWTLIGFIGESEIRPTIRTMMIRTILTSIITFVIGAIIALLVAKSITKEIKKINLNMGNVANGDLSQRIVVKKKNEFGELENNFNNMVDNVSVLIKGVEEKTGIIVDASSKISEVSVTTTETVSQVSEAIQSVSVGAAGQADSTKIASSEVENLANKLHETKVYVTDISQMSVETQQLSDKGITIVDDLIVKGQKSIDNSMESKDVVSEMVGSIEKINFISDVITEITEQTNLLSLNASIEAARAGESGKGFAVVADEIRKLAEQSQASTDEIKKIVLEITAKSEQVSKAMDESVAIINEQNVAINDAKQLFNTISDSVNALKEGLDNITGLNEDMDNSRVTVVGTMEDVAAVSTQTAAAAEEVTASAQEVNATMTTLNQFTLELDDIAAALNEAIKKFKL